MHALHLVIIKWRSNGIAHSKWICYYSHTKTNWKTSFAHQRHLLEYSCSYTANTYTLDIPMLLTDWYALCSLFEKFPRFVDSIFQPFPGHLGSNEFLTIFFSRRIATFWLPDEKNVDFDFYTIIWYITGEAENPQKIQYNTPYTNQPTGCPR